MSTLALARPLWISAPECPPVSPPTATVTPAPSKGARVRGSRQALVLPPAQLTVKMPSASESRFSICRPFSGVTSMEAAPSRPISSSTVNTASRRG